MSDLYLEELIKKQRTSKDNILRIGLMVLTAVAVIFALLTLNMVFTVVAIAICVADIFLFPRFSVEWEYQYVNGELDVDRILNKQRRKRMASYDVQNAELVAPAKSHRLDYYHNGKQLKVVDYSSCNPENEKKVYAMLISKENQLQEVLFEPSEKMLKDMRLKAPRKVFMD